MLIMLPNDKPVVNAVHPSYIDANAWVCPFLFDAVANDGLAFNVVQPLNIDEKQ